MKSQFDFLLSEYGSQWRAIQTWLLVGRVFCCACYLRYPMIMIPVDHCLQGDGTTNDYTYIIDEIVVPCSRNHRRYPHDIPIRYSIRFTIVDGGSATNHTSDFYSRWAFTRRTRGSHCPWSPVQAPIFPGSSTGYIPKFHMKLQNGYIEVRKNYEKVLGHQVIMDPQDWSLLVFHQFQLSMSLWCVRCVEP